MKIKLKSARAVHNGFQQIGDVIDVEEVEAGRMIRRGQAEALDSAEGKKAVAASEKDGKPLGRHYSPQELRERDRIAREARRLEASAPA